MPADRHTKIAKLRAKADQLMAQLGEVMTAIAAEATMSSAPALAPASALPPILEPSKAGDATYVGDDDYMKTTLIAMGLKEGLFSEGVPKNERWMLLCRVAPAGWFKEKRAHIAPAAGAWPDTSKYRTSVVADGNVTSVQSGEIVNTDPFDLEDLDDSPVAPSTCPHGNWNRDDCEGCSPSPQQAAPQVPPAAEASESPKRRGRPKGSKNKPKDDIATAEKPKDYSDIGPTPEEVTAEKERAHERMRRDLNTVTANGNGTHASSDIAGLRVVHHVRYCPACKAAYTQTALGDFCPNGHNQDTLTGWHRAMYVSDATPDEANGTET